MIRKILMIAAFLLTVATMKAQSVGDWNIFTRFAGNIDNIVETSEMVYYTSGNRLFSFNKESNETYAYNTRNKLNDTNISMMRYNPAGKYLFIGYDNGNIDLLYDNGRVVNMSDIKDATLTYDKGLRNVNFANDRIYLGTDFGIVIFDDKKHEVVESGIFGFPIESVAPVGEYLFIHRRQGATTILYAPLDGHHNTFSKFTLFTYLSAPWVMNAGDSAIIYPNMANGNKLMRYTFSFKDGKPGYGNMETFDVVASSGMPILTDKGNYITTAEGIVWLDEDGAPAETITLPAPLQSQKVATRLGAKSIWGGDNDGIANYSIDGGNLTVLSDKFKPVGIVTDEVFYTKFDNHGNLWLGNLGVSQYKAGYCGDFYWILQATTRIKDGKPEDMNAVDIQHVNSSCINQQKEKNTTRMFGGCTGFAVDPENPDRYYQGNNLEGLFVIENNKEIHRFNWLNSPFQGNWGSRVMDVQFDPDGNLWVGIWSDNANVSPFWVLPRKTLRSKDIKDIAKSDWLPSKHQGIDAGNKDLSAVYCKKSPVMLSFHSIYRNPLGVLLTKGTWDNPNDDEMFELIKPVDQDGKVWEPDHIICGVEDQRGRVWLGTTAGIVEITNPGQLTPTSRVTRIKVPRNDGTNYADYLCETDIVYSIAVDNSNRKWIATETSGVYLVSENGDQILEHFTVDNSPLPSNMVLSVACDPNSNTVYFGLKTDLVSYNSTSSPAADDFSEVYAYPNPVRPDYTGYITITGLMDNSLVKITDTEGRVVFQTRSEGGMAIWDGFDSNHNRVKTGVYYVFASQNDNGSASGAVTKIMVVR